MKKTHEIISSLQYHRPFASEEMVQTIDNQLILENHKLEKLEQKENQWISRDQTSLSSINKIRPRLQRLLSTTKERTQLLGIDMINILDLYMHKNMENLSSLTILTIDIQTSLHT